jgi:small subunit ribosomal protein S6
MNKYELVIIVDAALLQEEKEQVIKEVCETIVKSEGQVINSQLWLDRQKFSFRLKKRTEGTYYLVNFEGAMTVVAKLRQLLKLNERVLRNLIIKNE